MPSMTPEQVEEIATRAASVAARSAVQEVLQGNLQDTVRESVRQTLVQLGMDQQNPLEMQRDFQHLRSWRKTNEAIRDKGLLALLGLFITGVVSLLLVGVRDYFRH